MKSITQEHACGCSVACVAAILGISYKNALRLFENPDRAATKGFYCRDIVNALKKKGMDYSYVFMKTDKKSMLSIPRTIVFIRKSKRYPLGHFLVRDKKGLWMDPWINYPRINPAKSDFRKKLPGKASWIVYPK